MTPTNGLCWPPTMRLSRPIQQPMLQTGPWWTQCCSVICPSTRNTAKSYVCDSPPAEGTTYCYYRFLFTDSKSSSTPGVSLAEIEMMETTEQIPASATLT